MVHTLSWQGKDGPVNLQSLQDLLRLLIDIPVEDIDTIIAKNKSTMIHWVQQNFPKQLQLLTHMQDNEATPQQLREQMIRDLRKITSSA
jgi:hypothetical protein